MLLFITILLIGAGFGFIKHVLSKREKQLFVVVLSLQVSGNGICVLCVGVLSVCVLCCVCVCVCS